MANVSVRASDDGDKAQDSSAYRAAETEEGGILGKIVSNLPDGRKESAPESYDARPRSRTLEVGGRMSSPSGPSVRSSVCSIHIQTVLRALMTFRGGGGERR